MDSRAKQHELQSNIHGPFYIEIHYLPAYLLQLRLLAFSGQYVIHFLQL